MLLIPKRHGQTDGRTDRRLTVALPPSALASRGKKINQVILSHVESNKQVTIASPQRQIRAILSNGIRYSPEIQGAPERLKCIFYCCIKHNMNITVHYKIRIKIIIKYTKTTQEQQEQQYNANICTLNIRAKITK